MTQTTLLPVEEVDFLRSIKKTALILLVMGMIDRQPPGRSVKPAELSAILELDIRTIASGMESLSARNRLIKSGYGYVLTANGRALLLSPSEAPAQAPNYQALAPQALEGYENGVDFADEIPDESGKSWDAGAAGTTHNVCAPEEEDSLILNPDIDSSSSIPSAQSVQSQPTTAEILEGTEILFGKTMSTIGISDRPRRLAIGWVAQAYDQRQHLRSPQGLIYKRLQARSMPLQKYYEHPLSFLTREYLVRLGLADPLPVTETEDTINPPEITEADMQVQQPVLFMAGEGVSPDRAWQRVIDELRPQMARASFEKWVLGTRAVQIQDGRLEVIVRDEYTREWLESRLSSTINRLLIGILNAEGITVKYVVGDAEDR